MKEIDPNLFGARVTVIWQDTQAHINEDLADVTLAECRSEGILIGADDRKLILRSAHYPGTPTGDYTAIPRGCIDAIESQEALDVQATD